MTFRHGGEADQPLPARQTSITRGLVNDLAHRIKERMNDVSIRAGALRWTEIPPHKHLHCPECHVMVWNPQARILHIRYHDDLEEFLTELQQMLNWWYETHPEEVPALQEIAAQEALREEVRQGRERKYWNFKRREQTEDPEPETIGPAATVEQQNPNYHPVTATRPRNQQGSK